MEQGRGKKEEGKTKKGNAEVRRGTSTIRPSVFPLFPLPSSLLSDLETVLLGELLDAAFGIDELPLPREERMAARANLDTNVLFRGTSHKGRATGATDDRGLAVLGMDTCLHKNNPSLVVGSQRDYSTVRRRRSAVTCSGPVQPSGLDCHLLTGDWRLLTRGN